MQASFKMIPAVFWLKLGPKGPDNACKSPQVCVYENTALAGLGFLCMFGFPSFPLGDPPIIKLGFHCDFHYYLNFLRLLGLLSHGPCMAMFSYVISEPNGITRGTPSPPFLGTSLPLSW